MESVDNKRRQRLSAALRDCVQCIFFLLRDTHDALTWGPEKGEGPSQKKKRHSSKEKGGNQQIDGKMERRLLEEKILPSPELQLASTPHEEV